MRFFLTVLITAFIGSASAQDTFSIVAVDLATGQVGSAGATCLDDNQIAGGAVIISDVIPDVGAIHTQSYWIPANQNAAHDQVVDNGLSPEELMAWLEENDAENNPAVRQYGMADLVSGVARAAAFTGDNCIDFKGHIVGENYAIQGNILLGEEILTQMEAGFLETEGALAEKLMAALQGANVAGADNRCLEEGVSSRSAFLRVAYPGDGAEDLTLDLVVSLTPFGVEPIDVLQAEFNAWNGISSTVELYGNAPLLITRLEGPEVLLKWSGDTPAEMIAFDAAGARVGAVDLDGPWTRWALPATGTLFLRIVNAEGQLLTTLQYAGDVAPPNTQRGDRE
ncbi:MAG: DUF1028 domain-containing protein [Crocinitomicaceae bacterium TMED114]|nr:MAG: DUF1028 domain-containing protein [Crocinitomicaceae bacterium TMED114]